MSSERYRILCADDHDDTCFMLSALLGARGYEVKSAGSVSEALNIAGMEDFDLFILDAHYTDGSGFDLCLQLRRMKPTAQLSTGSSTKSCVWGSLMTHHVKNTARLLPNWSCRALKALFWAALKSPCWSVRQTPAWAAELTRTPTLTGVRPLREATPGSDP